jgi:hypothetical protein
VIVRIIYYRFLSNILVSIDYNMLILSKHAKKAIITILQLYIKKNKKKQQKQIIIDQLILIARP